MSYDHGMCFQQSTPIVEADHTVDVEPHISNRELRNKYGDFTRRVEVKLCSPGRKSKRYKFNAPPKGIFLRADVDRIVNDCVAEIIKQAPHMKLKVIRISLSQINIVEEQ